MVTQIWNGCYVQPWYRDLLLSLDEVRSLCFPEEALPSAFSASESRVAILATISRDEKHDSF